MLSKTEECRAWTEGGKEEFTDAGKVSQPLPNAKIALHNFTISVFRLTQLTSLPLFSLHLQFLSLALMCCTHEFVLGTMNLCNFVSFCLFDVDNNETVHNFC